MAPLTDGIDFTARLDYRRVGDTWFHTVQNNFSPTLFGAPGLYSQTKRQSFDTLDLRAGFQTDRWSVIGFVKNLTDEDYLEEVIPVPEFGGSFIHPGTKARAGVEVTYLFN